MPNLVLSLLWPDVIAEGILHVDKASVSALSNLVDSSELLLSKLEVLEVALNTGWVRRLGQDSVATLETPGNEDLSKGSIGLLCDLEECGVCRNFLAGAWDLILGPEGRVGLDENVVLLAVLDDFVVGKEGMNLDLVDRGRHLSIGKKLIELLRSEVRDTNGSTLSSMEKFLHSTPCRLMVLCQFLVDDILF